MKHLLIIYIITFLVGCDDSLIKKEGQLRTYNVNGNPLECINKGRGLSCNWEKYNASTNI